jgi:hypothetical protein
VILSLCVIDERNPCEYAVSVSTSVSRTESLKYYSDGRSERTRHIYVEEFVREEHGQPSRGGGYENL